jgi:hypothetical protein
MFLSQYTFPSILLTLPITPAISGLEFHTSISCLIAIASASYTSYKIIPYFLTKAAASPHSSYTPFLVC